METVKTMKTMKTMKMPVPPGVTHAMKKIYMVAPVTTMTSSPVEPGAAVAAVPVSAPVGFARAPDPAVVSLVPRRAVLVPVLPAVCAVGRVAAVAARPGRAAVASAVAASPGRAAVASAVAASPGRAAGAALAPAGAHTGARSPSATGASPSLVPSAVLTAAHKCLKVSNIYLVAM